MRNIDRFRGCLIGGAVGDALGYAVEFDKLDRIIQRYGEKGITEYKLVDGVAPVSDDTQMTLFTANGLLLGTTRSTMQGRAFSYPDCIGLCYRDWLKTQRARRDAFEPPEHAWLNNVPEMNHSRAPGGTCLYALEGENLGSMDNPCNNSKGCGGVMRVAPIGLYFEGKEYTLDQIDKIGAEAAALTHGHELGYIPAAMLVHIVHLLAHSEDMTVREAVEDAKAAAARLFSEAENLNKMLALTDRAIQLAEDEGISERTAIFMLGEGWVAEETLAVAIYCSLRYENDFERAIIASVNHSGDSDSTGSVTGNILGAHLGMRGIPQKYLDRLELKDTILEMADDLFYDCPASGCGADRDSVWARKYVDHTYPKG